MNRTWPLAATLLLLLVPIREAHSGSLGLRWNTCVGDGGIQNQVFACNTNTGSDALVASFIPTLAMHGVTDIESRIDLTFASGFGTLPAWWNMRNAGSCRPSSLTSSAILNIPGATCVDWGGGNQIGIIASYGPVFGHQSLQYTAYLPGFTADLDPGQEYFAYAVIINHQKTVGTGACAGCEIGACLSLPYIEFDIEGVGVVTLSPEFSGTDWLASWQGGIPGGLIACARTTPARQSTWGAVKQLYR